MSEDKPDYRAALKAYMKVVFEDDHVISPGAIGRAGAAHYNALMEVAREVAGDDRRDNFDADDPEGFLYRCLDVIGSNRYAIPHQAVRPDDFLDAPEPVESAVAAFRDAKNDIEVFVEPRWSDHAGQVYVGLPSMVWLSPVEAVDFATALINAATSVIWRDAEVDGDDTAS